MHFRIQLNRWLPSSFSNPSRSLGCRFGKVDSSFYDVLLVKTGLVKEALLENLYGLRLKTRFSSSRLRVLD